MKSSVFSLQLFYYIKALFGDGSYYLDDWNKKPEKHKKREKEKNKNKVILYKLQWSYLCLLHHSYHGSIYI